MRVIYVPISYISIHPEIDRIFLISAFPIWLFVAMTSLLNVDVSGGGFWLTWASHVSAGRKRLVSVMAANMVLQATGSGKVLLTALESAPKEERSLLFLLRHVRA